MQQQQVEELSLLDKLKRLVVVAMFSDDELFEHLVLKGGNAMDLIHRLSTRASVDLDFSMQHDFPEGIDKFQSRVEKALVKTFLMEGYRIFDVKMLEKPKGITADMADFWGGYGVEFKIINTTLFEEFSQDIEGLRRRALNLGRGPKFLIDISRYEYTLGKQQTSLDHHTIYVYSPEMIVCEKLRAICQQMPKYGEVIKRDRAGSPRARDFVDIHVLVDKLKLNISDEANIHLLTEMFKAKRVPLSLLGQIEHHKDFHAANFSSVVDTVKAGIELEPFDYYFDFVLSLVSQLKPLWNK